MRYVAGHHHRIVHRPKTMPESAGTPTCDCGCGQPVTFDPNMNWSPEEGRFLGQYRQYVVGHSRRGIAQRSTDADMTELYTVRDHGYETPCWDWNLFVDPRLGYGRYSLNIDGEIISPPAHRYMWEAVGRTIPDGQELDHLCRNRQCVNPDHLEPVTHAENMRRSRVAKLTVDDVREIRRLHASGVPRRDIALLFGITPRYVTDLARGKSWKDAG